MQQVVAEKVYQDVPLAPGLGDSVARVMQVRTGRSGPMSPSVAVGQHAPVFELPQLAAGRHVAGPLKR